MFINAQISSRRVVIAAIYRERSGRENERGSAEVFFDGAAESHQEGDT